jgi:hypothetical protein
MTEQQNNPLEPSSPQEAPPSNLAPHRGVLILILGIAGIVCCFIAGIVAWILGNKDLEEMAQGRMDPTGQGLTQAGKICGIVSVVLQIIGIIIWFLVVGFSIGTSAIGNM